MNSETPVSTPGRQAAVIIPARNAEDTLGEQLQALSEQQADFEWEVIVVDNGSTDGTRRLAESFSARIPHLRVISCERPGANAARNDGARSTSAPHLLYCDADDVVASGWVQALSDRLLDCDGAGGHIDNDTFGHGYMPAHPPGLPLTGGFLPRAITANFAVRRDAWAAIGGFSEDYRYGATDTEFNWRLQLSGRTLCYAPEASVAYRSRTTLKGAIKKSYLTGRARARLYRDFRQSGMPRPSVLGALRRWATLLAAAPAAVVSPQRRWDMLRGIGAAAGRIVGSWHNRVLYL